jgi:hypothetical protein
MPVWAKERVLNDIRVQEVPPPYDSAIVEFKVDRYGETQQAFASEMNCIFDTPDSPEDKANPPC